MSYPFIVRYEDWLKLPTAHDDFFGQKTQNWFPYSNDPNWNVRFEYALQTDSGEYTDFKVFDIHTYDDWTEAFAWSFTKLDLTPITTPYDNEVTRIVGTATLDTEDYSGNEWSVAHTRNLTSSNQWMLSSLLDASNTNNPLSPVGGDTKLKLTILDPKNLQIEGYFDPSKVDISKDVTFTGRIDADTTGGKRRVIFKQTFKLARRLNIPELRGGGEEPAEDRGGSFCCDNERVLADLDLSVRYRNDLKSFATVGDSATFTLKKDGVVTSYTPVSVPVVRETDAFYTTIEWRDVAASDGFGCYTLEIDSISAGIANPTICKGPYDLKPYQSGDIYNGNGTFRVLSEFNDVNDELGIDFTDTRMRSSVRVPGKFGYWQQNTETKNVEYHDGNVIKNRREDFRSYEIRTNKICNCLNEELLFHVLAENSTWLSDHNFNSPDKFLRDIPVIVKEGAEITHFDDNPYLKTVVIYEQKVRKSRTHFQDNRQTAENLEAPPICAPIVISGVLTSVGWQTGQTAIYESGDDGDEQRGGGVDFFTLTDNNFFSNPDRFTDTLGGQTYANNIVIDWSTFNPDTGDVNWWYRIIDATQRNWVTCYAFAASLNIAGFTNWILPNENEIMRIKNSNVVFWINYPPFNIVANYAYATTTTTPLNTLLFSAFLPASNTLNPRSKALVSYRVLAMRIGNISEL